MGTKQGLLDDLIYYPNLTRRGQFNPTQLWVSPDYKESWLVGMKKRFQNFNALPDQFGEYLFLEALLSIDSPESKNERAELMRALKSEKVGIIITHAGIIPGLDEEWRYVLGNGEYPLVADLLKELDTKGLDMLYFNACNRGHHKLQPRYTPVLHLINSPEDEPGKYIIKRP